MVPNVLPPSFADLEPFVDWALPTERERNRQRLSSSMDELRAFHRAMLPRMPAIIEHLNDYDLEAMPADVQSLHYMTLSLAEIAPAVDWFHQPGVTGGYDTERFTPLHQG